MSAEKDKLKSNIASTKQQADAKEEIIIKRPFWLPLICCLLVLTVVCLIFTYNGIVSDFKYESSKGEIVISDEERVLFVIEDGNGTTTIANRLKDLGLISNVNFFKIVSKYEGYDGTYKTGSHYLKKGLEMRDIMKILAGPTETIKVTFPEGFTVKKIAARLEANNLCSAEDFLKEVNACVNDSKFMEEYTFLQGLDFSNRDYALEGYLFPDTYYFDLAAKPRVIIEMMLDNFYNRYLLSYNEKATSLGFQLDDVIKLASIVERECKVASERRKVAGVFYNRMFKTEDTTLKYLQSCATLQYIIERDTGAIKDQLTLEDEKIQDVYNTYIHQGLTPGPICSPGIASIKAVLNLEEHDYYFFVLDSRTSAGTHLFAKTLEQHERNQDLLKEEE